MKFKIYTGAEVRKLRRDLRLNQQDFWSHFQIGQSGGSRYESGRDIPHPVQLLLNIAFCTATKSEAIVEGLTQFGRPTKKARSVEGK